MKFILTGSLCLFFVFGAFAQTKDLPEKTEQSVEKLSLARKDKDGNIEEGLEVFNTKDIPITCYIDLSSDIPTLVKMNFIAVKAKGLRADIKIVTVSYKTKDGENSVSFNASPNKIWAVGDYRVDIFLDGKLAASKEFKIEAKVN
ncbi:MAG: hypothetical protein M3405_10730 [Acidobacteriota bacterium]|nr:hypothetical protein [Acidobacteriota bacterium]